MRSVLKELICCGILFYFPKKILKLWHANSAEADCCLAGMLFKYLVLLKILFVGLKEKGFSLLLILLLNGLFELELNVNRLLFVLLAEPFKLVFEFELLYFLLMNIYFLFII